MRIRLGMLGLLLALFTCSSIAFGAADVKLDDDKTYTVSGSLTGPMREHLNGVTVRLRGGTIDESTETMGSGEYSFRDIPEGTYTVTPKLEGHYFEPGSRDVTVNDMDVTVGDFEASHGDGTFYDITILVVDKDSNPMQDVEVSLTGVGVDKNDLSYKDGTVTFEDLANTLTYEVSVSLDEWTFEPNELTVTIDGRDVMTDPIVGTRDIECYMVSGRLVDADGNGIDGVELELKCVSCSDEFEATSGPDGSFEFSEVPENDYIVVPYHADYTFEPEAVELTINRADFTVDDIVGTKK